MTARAGSRRLCVLLLAALAATACPAWAQFPLFGINVLKSCGKIDGSLVEECSGLVQSLRYGGVYWALGDSGNAPAIVPVLADGTLARGWAGPVRVEGVRNNDWEDIALDGKGDIIIADTGNNGGARKQLMLHFVKEPKPGATGAKLIRTLRVHYADQNAPSPDYDCEAVFCAAGRVYLLTKRQSDGRSCLYRVDGDSTAKSNPLRLVDSFDIGGTVTAADVSPDGRFVAVLTYTALWVFEFDAKAGRIRWGSGRKLPIFAWQAEALAFDGNAGVLIGNEGGQLYRVPLADLPAARP